MIKMAGIWSPLENAIYWISNDSLAKISHNYPYTANTVEPQYNEGQGPGTVNVYSGSNATGWHQWVTDSDVSLGSIRGDSWN